MLRLHPYSMANIAVLTQATTKALKRFGTAEAIAALCSSMRIDKKDARILALVQSNSRLTAEQIGEEIGLSHTAVVRRLRRLREHAVITAEVALVSAEAVGYPVRVNVSCSIERDAPDTHDRFIEALRSEPAVISADCVMGKADFTFTVVARSMEHLRDFVRRLQMDFPSLKDMNSLVVLEEVKRGQVIPVEPTRS